jgi:hypothetical protein
MMSLLELQTLITAALRKQFITSRSPNCNVSNPSKDKMQWHFIKALDERQ